MTRCYNKNGQKKSDHDKILDKSSDCTKEILEAKNNYILKMTTKLQNPKTAAKTYWGILSRLLHNKKIPAIPPLLVNDKFASDICEKASFFNKLLHHFQFMEEDISLIKKIRSR